MKWLVTGAGGMLGRDTVDELTRRGEQVTGLDRAALDITRAEAVERALSEHRPGIVVNCAAYTAVDDAETDEERATLVNGDGPRLLARACAAHGARLIHVSTDYVFSGDARATPIPRTIRPPRAPPTAAPSWPASAPCWRSCPARAPSCAPPGCTESTAPASCGR